MRQNGSAMRCAFWPRPAPGKWAMTACNGDPADTASWRREALPLCLRRDALDKLGWPPKGESLKATSERW